MKSKPNNKAFVGLVAISVALTLGIIVSCTGSSTAAKPNIVHKESTKKGIAAKIGDEEITDDQLIGDAIVKLQEIKKQEYDLKMGRLNEIMREKLIGAEAKKANMPLNEYIDKKVIQGKVKVSDKEFNDFVEARKVPKDKISPQLKERIVAFLEEQKKDEVIQQYVAKLTKDNPVEAYFEKPKPVEIKYDGAPLWGNKDAPVTIVEFSDFQCPFCSRAAEVVDEVKKKYGTKKIKLAYRHFPLPMHKDALPAAVASLCVNDQGTDKFWKFHDKLFKNQSAMGTEDLNKYAKESGSDMGKFKECMDSKKFEAKVQEDMSYGEKIGVSSTPTFFINGQLLSGAQPLEAFSKVIDEELAK